jgi:transposase-like protein
MSRREDRERRIAGWLEHLEGWKASGEALSTYARSHGIETGSMYYWRSVLRQEGRWPGESGETDRGRRPAVASESARVPLRFARVKLERADGGSALTIRVTLANGRRAEIELQDTQRLSEVLGALECPI